MNSLTSVSAEVRARLNADAYNVGGTVFTVRSNRRSKDDQIVVSWQGTPTADEVQEKVADLFVDVDATLVTRNKRRWTCGSFHEEEFDAWKAHEGAEHLTWVCSCGALDGCFTAEESDDEYNARKCNAFSHKVLTDDTYVALENAGETFTSSCAEGDYGLCAWCRGGAYVGAAFAGYASDCHYCEGKGVLNMTDDYERSLYVSTVAALRVKEEKENTK